MAPHEMQSTLSPEQVDAIEARNDQQSPLLRLPGELRNRIFEYACSGFIITPYSGHIWASQSEYSRLSGVCAISFVSRKLYAETRILPFKLSTFAIPDESWLKDLVNFLSDAQLRAISSICVDYETVLIRRFESHVADLPLHHLPGLSRVLIQGCPLLPASLNPLTADLRLQIQTDCGRADVEIVFEQCKEWVEEEWQDYDSEGLDDSDVEDNFEMDEE